MKESKTLHKILLANSQSTPQLEDCSIDLIVTSPPYPMIEMWDDTFSRQNPKINKELNTGNGKTAYELMHQELDKVWIEIHRVLKPGGIACINIGDATRSLGDEFSLYPNHARIISKFLDLGFNNLPNIIWRKQTNAPNKFMGSGMLPAGAYVTLEHEWVLIFRKGGKRNFRSEHEKNIRRNSSFFWEERNTWFSDVWEIKGIRQSITTTESRNRSGAFPLELPYRLINMYSLKGDTVYDPFLGTGTTTMAAIISERNSVGVEIDKTFGPLIYKRIENLDLKEANNITLERIRQHAVFISEYKKEIKHFNQFLRAKVITSQETEISFSNIKKIEKSSANNYKVYYKMIDDIDPAPDPSLRTKKQQSTLNF